MTDRKTPSARASLEKRPLKVLRRLVHLEDSAELGSLLGPLVSRRHPLEAFQTAARKLLAEREEARARRMGEPTLTEADQAELRAAGSRLLGLAPGGSPLLALSDEALETVRRERDPARLAERLAAFDPEGNWSRVPRMGLLAGMVMVAVSGEAERRWKTREAENLARRAGRSRG